MLWCLVIMLFVVKHVLSPVWSFHRQMYDKWGLHLHLKIDIIVKKAVVYLLDKLQCVN